MSVQLLHIYGPIAINTYGTMIAIGTLVVISLLFKDKKCLQLVSEEVLANGISLAIIVGLFGGRLLWFLEQAPSTRSIITFFSVWYGGLSILGAVATLSIFIPLYFFYHNIPILAISDRIALYLPIAHFFGRLGCYFAGCCYGIATALPWGAVYHSQNYFAPYGIPIHPTQLYSAALQLFLFIFLWKIKDNKNPHGVLLGYYLVGSSFCRFIVDFLRADRTLVLGTMSSPQCIALFVMVAGFTLLLTAKYAKSLWPKSF